MKINTAKCEIFIDQILLCSTFVRGTILADLLVNLVQHLPTSSPSITSHIQVLNHFPAGFIFLSFYSSAHFFELPTSDPRVNMGRIKVSADISFTSLFF